MQRQTIIFALLFVWIFAIITPSVLTLMDTNGKSMLVMNLNEEEHQDHTKKEVGKNQIAPNTSTNYLFFWQQQKSVTGNFYIAKLSDPILEILSPPPEHYL